MSSITGLGLRNKVGIGKSNDTSSKPKAQGSSITGLGLRNKAAGLAGSKKSPDDAAREHVAIPRSALKDPSSFAPPPKNINYHGAAAAERQVDRIPQKGPLTPAEYQAREKEKADRAKEEAAREREQRRLERVEKQRLRSAQQEEEAAYGPPLPVRSDTTGLSTTQFAPPVARRTADDGTIVIRPTAPAKPSLPPRLPDRQNSFPKPAVPSPPPSRSSAAIELPSHRGQLHQGSLNRLGAAGVSVPGFGIGSPEQSPTQYTRPTLEGPARSGSSRSSNSLPTPSENPQLGELQSRFARMRAVSPTAGAPPQSTPWAEQGAPIKKAPPPRPKKKAELSGLSVNSTESPPPIPLSTRPR